MEEEREQLVTLQSQIAESSVKLEPLKDNVDFDKFNEILKKEIDKTQKKSKNYQNRTNSDGTLMIGPETRSLT